MNSKWHEFLQAKGALITPDNALIPSGEITNPEGKIYPLIHLGVLTVSGSDAAKLLQGQLTCDVNDVTDRQAKFTAMCNAKGRAISTFLLVKNDDCFQLVLPLVLAEKVKSKLLMYVLRSKVQITNRSHELCVLGASGTRHGNSPYSINRAEDYLVVHLGDRYHREILISEAERAERIWNDYSQNENYRPASDAEWRLADIESGIPWLTEETSEEFVPQMLSLDKLGGISFTKGCYTGQEVVARTHYLGKIKRELFLAQSECALIPAPNSALINSEGQTVGHVLQAQAYNGGCKLLVILAVNDAEHPDLRIKDYNHPHINLLPFAKD